MVGGPRLVRRSGVMTGRKSRAGGLLSLLEGLGCGKGDSALALCFCNAVKVFPG